MPGAPMEDRFPNLFIVGPHKTGTTSWYDALAAHPQVFMSPLKEPEFLNQDHDYTQRPVETEEAYLALFEDADDAKRRGEASPWYFYSEAATTAIRDRSDDPRVIISLRDPVERIYSLHSQRVHAGTEPIGSFEEALAAEPDRKQGKRVPDRANPVLGNFYREIAPYTPHVERYMDAFDENELLVLRFEDAIQDAEATYRKVCRFLDVDDTVDPTFPQSNPNTTVRSHAFRDIVRDPPQIVQRVTALFPIAWRDRAREILLEANSRETERPPMDPELRAELVDELTPDIEALEDLLGWDLSSWKQA